MLNSAQFVQMAWLTLYPSPRWGCGQAPTPQFPVQLRELKPFVLLRIQDSIKFGPRARFNMLLLSYWRVMGVKMDSLWKLYPKSTQVTKDKMLASSLNVSSLRKKKKGSEVYGLQRAISRSLTWWQLFQTLHTKFCLCFVSPGWPYDSVSGQSSTCLGYRGAVFLCSHI